MGTITSIRGSWRLWFIFDWLLRPASSQTSSFESSLMLYNKCLSDEIVLINKLQFVMYVQLATTRGVKWRLVEQEAHWEWDVTTAQVQKQAFVLTVLRQHWEALEVLQLKLMSLLDCASSTCLHVCWWGEAVVDKILEIKTFYCSFWVPAPKSGYLFNEKTAKRQRNLKKYIYTYVEKWHIYFDYNLVTDYQRSFVPFCSLSNVCK